MKRTRSKPFVPAGGGPHFDMGEPPPLEGRPATRLVGEADVDGAAAKVVNLLAEIIRRRRGEKG